MTTTDFPLTIPKPLRPLSPVQRTSRTAAAMASVAVERFSSLAEHLEQLSEEDKLTEECVAELEDALAAAADAANAMIRRASEATHAAAVFADAERETADLATIVGRNLRALRIAAAWTTQQLAGAMRRVGLDWDASTVTEVEDGDRSATVAELLALAGLYAVPMTDLLVSSSGDFLSWPTCGALPPQLVRDLVVGLEVVEGPDGREIKRVKGGLTWLPGLIFSGATTGPEDWRPAADLWSLGKVSGKYLVVLGDRLRGVRRRRGLTLQEVEVATDQKFRASVLGAYERGERAMSLARFLGLARFYGVSPEELLPTDNQVRAWMGLFLPRAREASA